MCASYIDAHERYQSYRRAGNDNGQFAICHSVLTPPTNTKIELPTVEYLHSHDPVASGNHPGVVTSRVPHSPSRAHHLLRFQRKIRSQGSVRMDYPPRAISSLD
eukprot:311243-Amorphochlora_amoeboformis.AAC.1